MFNLLHNKKMRTVFLLGMLLLAILLLTFGSWLLMLETFGHIPGAYNVDVEIYIQRGLSPRAISSQLKEEGLIRSSKFFYWYLRYIEQCPSCLKAGEYKINAKSTPAEIIALLRSGRQREYRFTVPEGSSKEDIARIIAGAGLASRLEVLENMSDPLLMHEFGIPDKGASGQSSVPGGMEGYLFPDTYQFPKGTPVADILRRMRERLDEVLEEGAVQERLKEIGLSEHQLLTMASLVEKETGNEAERPLIAGVFFNRLKKGMKLQTDPTAVYGLGHKGPVKRHHIRTPHDYNTYTSSGLPPGPIASPGTAAIRSVLWPQTSPYLYFVSKRNGTHEFCANYACHQRGIKQYLKP